MEIGSRVRSCDGHFLLDPKDPFHPYSLHGQMNSKAMYHTMGVFFSEWEQKDYINWSPPSPLISQDVW
jgi:hypothetical protein